MTPALTVEDLGLDASTTAELSVEHARRLAAVLDADDDLQPGSPLPLLWHWAYFTPAAPTSALGADGHPALAADGPTAGLPRRMWAGGRIEQLAPIELSEPATRRTKVARAEQKSGRSGDLLVVSLAHEIEQGGRRVLTEEQDLVYRAAPTEPTPAPEGDERPATSDGGWADAVRVEPPMLFRFSAVTFNSHRIHYDRAYATGEEGYPGLVVHGPLTAILLAESARRRGATASSFRFRAVAPLFASTPFTLVGRPDADGTALEAVRNDGTTAMTARLG
jgi:3-methylfumaryl-CoA hydratase